VIVVDANVAIKWTVAQPLRERARALLANSETLIAPAMFIAEVTATVWQYVKAGQISDEQARAGLGLTIDQIGLFEDDRELAADALSMAIELKHAPYDCFYLVLAMRRAAPLVTVDRRLINRLAGTHYSSHVVHLSDWN
jgi:predicted nucleic acid-binding protein